MKGRYEDQTKARKLRAEGYTIKEICDALSAAKGSVSFWVRDVEVEDKFKTRLKEKQKSYQTHKQLSLGRVSWSEKCADKRNEYREQGRQKAKENDINHAIACSLYWAEGAKDRNHFTFCNSDAGMIKLMVDFLDKNFNRKGKDLKLKVAFYENGTLTVGDVEKYWADVMGYTPDEITIQKHIVNPYNKNKVKDEDRKNHVNKLPYGVCHLTTLKGTEIVQHIYGAIEVYSKEKTVIDKPRINRN